MGSLQSAIPNLNRINLLYHQQHNCIYPAHPCMTRTVICIPFYNNRLVVVSSHDKNKFSIKCHAAAAVIAAN